MSEQNQNLVLHCALTFVAKRLSQSQKEILLVINGTRKNKYQISKVICFSYPQIHDSVQRLFTDGLLNEEKAGLARTGQQIITYGLTPISQALIPYISPISE